MADRVHSLGLMASLKRTGPRATLLIALVLTPRVSNGQQDCSAGGLAALIGCSFGPAGLAIDSEARLPDGSTHSAHFNSSAQVALFTLGQLNAALGTRLAALPLPSPASAFTYAFDPTSGVFTRSTRSFGPILSDRAETLGKHRVSIGLAFQSLSFETVDGLDLKGIRLVLIHDNPAAGTGRDDVVTSQTSIKARTRQLTTVINYGLGERFDLSLAVPLVSVDLEVGHKLSLERVSTTNTAVHFFRDSGGGFGTERTLGSSGNATGFGDLTLRAKWNVFRGTQRGIAVGADLRVPTGAEKNLLGSGAPGIKPFVVISASRGSFSPHLNLGYQRNGSSTVGLAGFAGEKRKLPDEFGYRVGVDIGIKNKLTVAVDLLGTRTLSGVRFEQSRYALVSGGRSFLNTGLSTASYNVTDLAVGVKVAQVFAKLLLDVNVVFKLDNASLRARFTPLVGLEYSF